MMYFAPVVLEQATGNNEAALFMTIWIGVVQLIGTSIGAFLMDRVGRVPLLRIGAIGSAVGLLMTSYFLYQAAGLAGSEAVRNGYFILSGMLLFMLFFAFSWAVGAWVVVSEIFPNRMRSEGMSLAIAAMWVSNFIIGLGFPLMNDNTFLLEHFNGAFPMWLFAGCCVLAYFFVTRFLPETKGVTLEQMEETMLSKTRLEAKEVPVEMARANG
jgi:SP family xylose:H+ symportor-like MFS transporter